jgi:hypothetical protein
MYARTLPVYGRASARKRASVVVVKEGLIKADGWLMAEVRVGSAGPSRR